MTHPALDDYPREHLDEFIRETSELCAQPSVSARAEGTHECAALAAQILERHGFRVTVFETPGNPIIVGQAAGRSERTLLFYNHYDVQPPEPLELWISPPFTPTVRDGALYARGADDDKGEFMARLLAVEAARAAHGGELPCGVTFVVEGEEEIGSPHIAQFVREHTDLLRCQGALWEEGGLNQNGFPGLVLGRRGLLYVEFSVQTLVLDAHSGGAHMFPNAAWRLLRALASLKAENERILIPGFYDQARPPSARDLEVLAGEPDPEAWARLTHGVQTFVGGLSGPDLNQAVFNPTANIAGLTAGYQGDGLKTVIPARATAKLDFRLVPDQDPDDIFAKLRAHLDQSGFGDVQVRRLGAMWPDKVEADHPLVRLAARTAEEVYQKPYQMRVMAGGSSPVYAFARPLGNIPVISAGVSYFNNHTHAPNEHVRLVDFVNAARHIARIIAGFGGLE